MTEPDAPPTPPSSSPAEEPVPDARAPRADAGELGEPASPTGSRPGRDALLPWLCGLGFVVLAGAIGVVWWSASQAPQAQAPSDLQALKDRVARVEQRPAATPVDLGPLTARVTALEQRAAPDLAPLQARIAALEQKAGDSGSVAARVDALSGRVDALAGRDQGAIGDLGRRLDADEARLAALERTAAQMTATAAQAARLARIEVAQAALAAGQPLGDLPNAPPAVSRFAVVAPPTEASLRLAFPKAVLAASHTQVEAGDTFFARMLGHAADLVTVRQGDRVLVGDPDSGVLARARTALDAGDLAGAVAAVSGLSAPPAAAMAAWLADAKALLAARAGLADMAAHA